MDILDRIKQFINESIQSLFERQKEDLTHVFKKEILSALSDMKKFSSEQIQTKERDMANLLQTVHSLSQGEEKILNRLDSIKKTLDELKVQRMEKSSSENQIQSVPSKHVITVFFAKMVDSKSPLGFKIDNLKTKEDGCAFKITLVDDLEGNYEIVDDKEIHQEMLAAFNPLISDSSDCDIVPQNPTDVSVVIPGVVVKENNVLRIVNKQKIKII